MTLLIMRTLESVPVYWTLLVVTLVHLCPSLACDYEFEAIHCQTDGRLSLRCADANQLRILSAQKRKLGNLQCSRAMQTVHEACYIESGLRTLLKNSCDGRYTCSVNVSELLVSNPSECPSYSGSPLLYVKYRCEPPPLPSGRAWTKSICNGQEDPLPWVYIHSRVPGNDGSFLTSTSCFCTLKVPANVEIQVKPLVFSRKPPTSQSCGQRLTLVDGGESHVMCTTEMDPLILACTPQTRTLYLSFFNDQPNTISSHFNVSIRTTGKEYMRIWCGRSSTTPRQPPSTPPTKPAPSVTTASTKPTTASTNHTSATTASTKTRTKPTVPLSMAEDPVLRSQKAHLTTTRPTFPSVITGSPAPSTRAPETSTSSPTTSIKLTTPTTPTTGPSSSSTTRKPTTPSLPTASTETATASSSPGGRRSVPTTQTASTGPSSSTHPTASTESTPETASPTPTPSSSHPKPTKGRGVGGQQTVQPKAPKKTPKNTRILTKNVEAAPNTSDGKISIGIILAVVAGCLVVLIILIVGTALTCIRVRQKNHQYPPGTDPMDHIYTEPVYYTVPYETPPYDQEPTETHIDKSRGTITVGSRRAIGGADEVAHNPLFGADGHHDMLFAY